MHGDVRFRVLIVKHIVMTYERIGRAQKLYFHYKKIALINQYIPVTYGMQY